jgi:hypothetical protein
MRTSRPILSLSADASEPAGSLKDHRLVVSLPKPWLRIRTLSVLVLITSAAALLVHSMAAAVFYDTNTASLQIVGENAVRTAAEYLPKEPSVAVLIADNYATTGGIAPDEIVLTRVAGDDRAITLSLRRRIPGYVAFLALGLPSREIRVTVSARKTARPVARILASWPTPAQSGA